MCYFIKETFSLKSLLSSNNTFKIKKWHNNSATSHNHKINST